VKWENSDTILHTVIATSGLFRGDLNPNGVFEFRFDNAGNFPYSCNIHPGMAGTITVRP
jgi:plastocyanin